MMIRPKPQSDFTTSVTELMRQISERLDKAIAGGLITAVVFTALARGATSPWSVGIFELIIAILLLFWAIKARIDKRRASLPPAAIPLMALAVYGWAQCISITDREGRSWSLSMDVEATRTAVTAMSFLLIAFLIASNFYASHRRLRVLSNFLVFYGVTMAVCALLRQHSADHNLLNWLIATEDGSVRGTFLNRNHFSGYMELLALIPVPLSLARDLPRQTRLFYGFAAAVMGVAAIGSQSRGGMLSLAAGMTFIVVMSARLRDVRSPAQEALRSKLERARVRSKHAVVVGAISFTMIAGVFSLGAGAVVHRIEGTVHDIGSANPQADFTTGRRSIWKTTVAMIRANPFFGVGFGAFRTAYPVYSHGEGLPTIGQAHNEYLQVLADCGILGGVFALWFIAVVCRTIGRGIRSQDPLAARLALGGGAGIFAILVHSLFDFNLQLTSSALLFLLILGMVSQISATTANRDIAQYGYRAQKGMSL
jgi:O-antigen ligase